MENGEMSLSVLNQPLFNINWIHINLQMHTHTVQLNLQFTGNLQLKAQWPDMMNKDQESKMQSVKENFTEDSLQFNHQKSALTRSLQATLCVSSILPHN